jgi:hypothetical protein
MRSYDAKEVASGKLDAVLPNFHGWEGLDVGKDGASPVSSEYDGTFPYQGHLDRVVFDLENDDVPLFETVDQVVRSSDRDGVDR